MECIVTLTDSNPDSKRAVTPRFVVVGYINHDVNRYADGRELLEVGGGGFFASLAAGAVIPNVGFVTRVGNDFDTTHIRGRINADALTIDPHGFTGKSVQTYHDLTDFTKRSIELLPGVSAALGFQDVPANWISHSQGFLVSTMVPKQQRGFIESLVQAKGPTSDLPAVRSLTLRQPFVAIDSDTCWLQDATSTETVRGSMRMADIVFMNRVEADLLWPALSEVPVRVVKKDEEGAEVYFGDKKMCQVPAPHVTVVNVTGAGDVFAGTFLASIVAGLELDVALERAVNVASQSITQNGIRHILPPI